MSAERMRAALARGLLVALLLGLCAPLAAAEQAAPEPPAAEPAAEPEAEPEAEWEVRTLRPDAELPPITVSIDLGERRYSDREERDQASELTSFWSKADLVRDPAMQARLEAIAHRIITAAWLIGPRQVAVDAPAAVTAGAVNTQGEDAAADDGLPTFTFRILDSDEINAFSAWDGNIGITRGMLEFCHSDHEVAGILAHEVAHTLMRHLRNQTKRAERLAPLQLIALGLGFLLGEPAGALLMGQLATMGILNRHTQSAESEADRAAVYYAYRAGYNPVGLITAFERLERFSRSRPGPTELGVFQTHPWSDERAAELVAQIEALGLPVVRRHVVQGIVAGVAELDETRPELDGATEGFVLLFGKDPLMLVAESDGYPTAEARARGRALAINEALDAGLRSNMVRLDQEAGRWVVKGLLPGGSLELLDILPGDAAAADQDHAAYAHTVYRRFLARWRSDELQNGAL